MSVYRFIQDAVVTDDKEGHRVQAVYVACVIGFQLIAVVIRGMGPMPHIGGGVAHGVAVESFQVVNDGHQVYQCLAGIVRQGHVAYNE